jgi:hypothetical protein
MTKVTSNHSLTKANEENYYNLPMNDAILKLYKAKMMILKLFDLDVEFINDNQLVFKYENVV